MDFRELLAYKKSFSLAMEIFELSISFPKEEKYSLTDQIRRSHEAFVLTLQNPIEKEDISIIS